jgi:hypothetical protein
MNAHNSLLEHFSCMHDEFNSSNNRMKRAIDEIFEKEIQSLRDSLDYFNYEYLVVDKRKLDIIIDELEKNLKNDKIAHVSIYESSFNREAASLKQSMCSFFELKLTKGDNVKKKMSAGVKKIFDRMCDFNFLGFEEKLDNIIYNFKVDFEMKYIKDEYCKDDFNKIIRSFEHSLLESLRSVVANSGLDKQEIVSRHTMKGYEILDAYRKSKR